MIAVAIALIGAVLSWLRLPGLTSATVWAEDGDLFLTASFAHAPLSQLLVPYAGYLHVLPRILSDVVVAFVPVDGAGLALAVLSCTTVGGIAALVFLLARNTIPSIPLRLLAAGITVLAPLGPIEVMGNLANLHWYFLWLAPWLLLYTPASRRQAWLLGLVALISALTEVQVVVFLPLILLVRTRRQWPIWAGLALGLAAQTLASVLVPRPDPIHTQASGFVSVLRAFLAQVVVPMYASDPALLHSIGARMTLALIAAVPFIAATALVLVWGTRAQRILATTLALAAPLLWWLAVTVNRWQWDPRADGWLFVRYAVVPQMFLIGVVVVALAMIAQRGTRRSTTATALLAAVLLVALVAQFVAPQTTRSSGPEWSAGVIAARTECLRNEDRVSTTVLVAPTGPNLDWAATIACDRLAP